MMLSAACYAMYWYCDNKLFLGKLKVLDNVLSHSPSIFMGMFSSNLLIEFHDHNLIAFDTAI